jgi:tripartite-type tricarboxylate transporter receptor subunit TctC
MNRVTMLSAVLSAVATLVAAAPAAAQSYPSKPVRLIAPFVPGGATDVIGRLLAQGLQDLWGQSVLVENRAGAAGSIGAEIVAKAVPDGYTLLFTAGAVMTANQHLYKLSYDPLKDLVGVSKVAAGHMVIVVPPASKFTTLKELIAFARANPRKLTYGSAGVGSQTHLAAENFEFAAGTESIHIPYKGEAAAVADVMGGQIDWAMPNLGAAVGQIREKKLRALAITSLARNPALPDLPTVAEAAGIAGFENAGWFGLVAPAGIPKEVMSRLVADTQKVVAQPAFRERLATLGMQPVGNRPEEMAAFMRAESERFGRIIRERKIAAP